MWLIIWSIMAFNDMTIIQSFDTSKIQDKLQHVFAVSLDQNDNLYVLDAGSEKIIVWHNDGTYHRSFGRHGNGPGELNKPIQLCVTDAYIIVWQLNGLVSFFDNHGSFQYRIKLLGRVPKRFVASNDGHVLIGFRQMIEGDVFAVIEKRSIEDGALLQEIKRFTNPGFVQAGYGEGNAEINAYMPDLDLQTWAGTTFIGFGSEPVIYELDDAGVIAEEHRFEIPTNVPSDDERERYLTMTFPTDGGRIALRDLPNLKAHFNRPKAYYTQFTVKGEKVAFIRTPIGSLDSIGDGYSEGDFFINDLNTGHLVAKGAFTFPEDSQVYLRDGHVIAAIATEEGYDLCRLQINGF